MYVRRKRNRSGSISIVVVDKSRGKYREIKAFGTSIDPDEVDRICLEASRWISKFGGQQEMDFSESARALAGVKGALALVERTMLDAPQAILNRVYDRIGFNAIGDDILRHLAIARVCQPMSKTATVEYLKSYFDEDVKLHKIYRYMDKLHNTRQEKV